jgi:hypothetical protein
MFLGLAGPVAILLHCNFSLGSTNATVALFCALAVSASGVVGRLLYGRIHAGLFGRKLTLLDLRNTLAERRRALEEDVGAGSALELSRLERFETEALAPRGLLRGALRLLVLPVRRRGVERDADGTVARLEPEVRATITRDLAAYLDALQGVSTFTACERLFSLWHAVHLPLCVVLFGAALVHVVAVHVY